MSEHTIRLVGSEGEETANLVAEPRGQPDKPCVIVFKYRGRAIEENASDYFEAFCRVRRVLEKEGLIPHCYGASLNVQPSGMSRDMGGGLVAYRLTIGRKPSRSDLVKIFEEGSDVIPVYVERQQQFYDEWIAWVKSQTA